MTFPASLLVHSANLETSETLGTTDAYGVKVPTKVYTLISCRFGSPRGSFPNSTSGDRINRSPSCIVPAATAAVVGRLLTGLTAPYTQTYRIMAVKPAMIVASVSHLVLDLENVQ